jgi:ribonucleotide monophosphatase NagD (HAD superfamily)
MLLASTVLRTYARRLGVELVESGGDVVLLGRDRQFNFTRIAAAANAVRDGAELIVANPDRTHPGKDGAIVPETGALLASILACTGDVPYRVIGKPEPPMFWKALSLLGAEATNTVMIGDNVETDGRGALQTGMSFVHIDDWVARQNSPAQPADSALAGS